MGIKRLICGCIVKGLEVTDSLLHCCAVGQQAIDDEQSGYLFFASVLVRAERSWCHVFNRVNNGVVAIVLKVWQLINRGTKALFVHTIQSKCWQCERIFEVVQIHFMPWAHHHVLILTRLDIFVEDNYHRISIVIKISAEE